MKDSKGSGYLILALYFFKKELNRAEYFVIKYSDPLNESLGKKSLNILKFSTIENGVIQH
jgi:hypothetical protein